MERVARLRLRAILAPGLAHVHAAIDWTRGYEHLDKELQQIAPAAEAGRLYVDKLVKVWLKTGKEEWILVHVEVQTQSTADFAQSMFDYHCRLRQRYEKDVLSLAVLADDSPEWKPSTYVYECMGRCRITFEFPIVKLTELARDRERLNASGNPFAPIVLAHVEALRTRKNMEDRKRSKFELIKSLYRSGFGKEETRKILRVIDWLMDLPLSLRNEFNEEVVAFEKEQEVPYVTSFEEVGIEKGIEIGLEKGFEKGIEKGIEKGVEKGIRESIKAALDHKFKQAGRELFLEVDAIADAELLRRVFTTLLTSDSLEAVRAVWLQPK